MGIIAEGIKRRYESGVMVADAVDTEHLEPRVRRLAELADEMLSGPADSQLTVR